MRLTILLAGAALSALALTACDKAGSNATGPETKAAQKAAGDQTITAGLGDSSKFAAAAKAAGLDATLAGPGPYTVLVPSDAAFEKMPAGALDTLMKPEARSDLTAVMTYHILPGTILAADIGKAIDAGKGKAQLPTMGGGTLTATRDGDTIVLADKAGTKARLGTEEQRSNGVIQHIDAVMMPS